MAVNVENAVVFTTTLLDNCLESERCVQTGGDPAKSEKRKTRKNVSAVFLNEDEAKTLREFRVKKASISVRFMITLFNIMALTLGGVSEVLPVVPGMIGRYGNVDQECREKNAKLTKWVNRGQVSYLISMKTVAAVSIAIRNEYPELVRNNDIFIVLKGGCVWGDSLLERVGETGSSIDGVAELFKSGDNDTGVYINPLLNDVENIYARVQDIVHDTLQAEALLYGIGGERWTAIESSLESSTMPFACVLEERADVNIIDAGIFRKQILTTPVQGRYVYVSRNNLDFATSDEVVSFALLRLKIAFTGYTVTGESEQLSAELVDVAVSNPMAGGAINTFNKYRSIIVPANIQY